VRTRRRFLQGLGVAAVVVAALAIAASAPVHAERSAAPARPPIRHVFVIVLENKNADITFSASSPAQYLATSLPAQGQLLTQYYGIGHVSLDNYIAMISGQAPNAITQSDCLLYLDFAPPAAVLDGNGQAVGQGCVYPAAVGELPSQLAAAGLSWRGYMEDMKTPCRHPALGAIDNTQSAKVGDQYATRHNPFMYFHSIIDDDASCQQHVVDLSALPADLANADTTPSFSFISPDLCHDGHDTPCVDGQPGGLVSADAFLQHWVPQILDSAAFKQDGMLVITFDEAEIGDPRSAAACCGEVPGPNSPLPGIDGPGGGRVGAVVLSPSVVPGTVNDTPYNHYALLRSIEDIFALPHLGFAAAPGLRPFGADVFNRTAVAPAPAPAPATAVPMLPVTGHRQPMAAIAAALVAALAAAFLRRRATVR
jgi:hypothetical protein